MITSEQAHKLGIKFSYAEYLQEKDDYQEYGENFLIEQKHAFLFYEPGKGKTYPAVYALNQVCNAKSTVLILSTADSVKNMWNIDIVPQDILPENTVIMSFTSAIQEKTKQSLLKLHFDAIVVDESHKIKSHNAQISKLVYQLTKKCKYAWGLSGTPRGNNDLDIFCQFHNMNVSEWGKITYTYFVQNCCDTEKGWGANGSYLKVNGINNRYKAAWERNLAMYTQRVTYEDGEMPPLNITPVRIDYELTDEYKKAEDGIIQIDDYANTLTKLAAINKMQQACNGFLYITSEIDDSRKVYEFQTNKKLQWLKDNITNKPTAIVYLFEQDLTKLKELFPNATEIISEFKTGKSNVLLLQCSRCESFNLQMCNNMIFYTMDYSFIKFKQMLHRVWRRGQEEQTDIKVLIQKDTIEETIWKAVNDKKRLADIFMMAKGEVK